MSSIDSLMVSGNEIKLQIDMEEKDVEIRKEQELKMTEGKNLRKKENEEKMRQLREHEKDNIEQKSNPLTG